MVTARNKVRESRGIIKIRYLAGEEYREVEGEPWLWVVVAIVVVVVVVEEELVGEEDRCL